MKILRKKSYVSKIAQISFIFMLMLVLVSPAFATPCDNLDPDIPEGCNRLEKAAADDNATKKAADNNTAPKAADDNTGLNIKTGIVNPLSSGLDTIPKFIKAILDIVLLIGIPIVTLAIIYSGFLFVTAQGNSEKLKKAKQTFIYTLIGAALLLGSYVISEAIVGTVEEIKNENLKRTTQ